MKLIATLLLIIITNLPAPVSAETSKLWGTAGEVWNSKSRLPDYSHAGYHAGEAAIPVNPAAGNESTSHL